MKTALDQRELALAAMAPVIALALLNHFYKQPLLAAHLGWYWAADVLQFVVVPVLAWTCLLAPGGVTAAHLGLGPLPAHDRWHALVATFFGGLWLALWCWPVDALAGALWWQYADPPTLYLAMPSTGGPRWLVAVYCAFTAALIEEVVFRALPWIWLRGRLEGSWGSTRYVLLTSVVFAAVHSEQGPAGVVTAFWFGVLLARAFVRWRSLWPLILGHFIVDMVAFAPR